MTMTNLIVDEPLNGTFIRLENLSDNHFDGLNEIVDEYGERIFVHTHLGGSFEEYFDRALASRCPRTHAPFVLRDQVTGNFIGMSRLFSEAIQHRICEIGYTWYMPSSWGGPTNPEAKFLLMQHAFETCGLLRVQYSTDLRNLHSQAAIKKLGAKAEGVLRRHRILPDGTHRDTPIFSIIDNEWPDVRRGLLQRLEGYTR